MAVAAIVGHGHEEIEPVAGRQQTCPGLGRHVHLVAGVQHPAGKARSGEGRGEPAGLHEAAHLGAGFGVSHLRSELAHQQIVEDRRQGSLQGATPPTGRGRELCHIGILQPKFTMRFQGQIMGEGAGQHDAVDAPGGRPGNEIDNDAQVDFRRQGFEQIEIDRRAVANLRLAGILGMEQLGGADQIEDFPGDAMDIDGKGNAAIKHHGQPDLDLLHDSPDFLIRRCSTRSMSVPMAGSISQAPRPNHPLVQHGFAAAWAALGRFPDPAACNLGMRPRPIDRGSAGR